MARRRRKQRRSATRNTASLLALALPAPLQRVANSAVGPMLTFVGLPVMLVAGLLQVDWQNGAPHLKVNPEKASEIGQAVQDRLEHLPGHDTLEQWQQTARDTWNSHSPNSHQQSEPPSSGQSPYTASAPYSGTVNPQTRAPFPSTKPPGYVSTNNNGQPAANPAWGGQPQYPSQQQYPQQQYPQQQYPQQQYPQQQYPQQQYSQQQYPQQQHSLQLQQQQQQYTPQQQQYSQQQYAQPAYPAQLPWQTP